MRIPQIRNNCWWCNALNVYIITLNICYCRLPFLYAAMRNKIRSSDLLLFPLPNGLKNSDRSWLLVLDWTCKELHLDIPSLQVACLLKLPWYIQPILTSCCQNVDRGAWGVICWIQYKWINLCFTHTLLSRCFTRTTDHGGGQMIHNCTFSPL